MNEDTRAFMVALGYALIVYLPVFLYAQRGRRTGKISPKKAATLMALAFALMPLSFGMIFAPELILWELVGAAAGLFLLMWLGFYAGPLGMGWIGQWNGYEYPERKKKERSLSPAPENLSVPIPEKPRHSNWRRLMWEMAAGEMAVLLGVAFVFRKPFLVLLGGGIILIHVLIFAGIWRWQHKQLEEKGWRW